MPHWSCHPPTEDASRNFHPHHLQGHQHQRLHCHGPRLRYHHPRPVLFHYHLYPHPPRRYGCHPAGADVPSHPWCQHRYNLHRHHGRPRLRQDHRHADRPRPSLLQHLRHRHLVPHPLHASRPPQRCPKARKGHPHLERIPHRLHRHDVLRPSSRRSWSFHLLHARVQGLHSPRSLSVHWRRFWHCVLPLLVVPQGWPPELHHLHGRASAPQRGQPRASRQHGVHQGRARASP
mmetsp:Transcript_37548/g.82238  ORF Transcript_37548/g.82238 Transcript_37548/m.82238 type:complete len:233 (+) Transcript_37548:1088-1786(+)